MPFRRARDATARLVTYAAFAPDNRISRGFRTSSIKTPTTPTTSSRVSNGDGAMDATSATSAVGLA
jgi:hypothetical protein